MKTKPYPKIEEKPVGANESAVAYHSTNQVMSVYQVTDVERESIMRAKEQFLRGEFCTESEMDKMVAEWLS